MKPILLTPLNVFCAAVVLTWLSGCKPASIQITPPQPSTLSYSKSGEPISLKVVDKRSPDDKHSSQGDITADLKLQQQAFDAIPFIRSYLSEELQSRGYTVVLATHAKLHLNIQRITLYASREGSYAPYVLWAAMEGELVDNKKAKPISALVIKEYYPKFTYSELDGPLYSAALSLLIKDIATTIVEASQTTKVDDNTINKLSDQLVGNNLAAAETAIYSLAFSQNRLALPAVVEYLQSRDRPSRLAAIYAIGVLKGREYLPTLIARYLDSSDRVEKATLLKAIWDIGTLQAHHWASEEIAKLTRSGKQDPTDPLLKTAHFLTVKPAQ